MTTKSWSTCLFVVLSACGRPPQSPQSTVLYPSEPRATALGDRLPKLGELVRINDELVVTRIGPDAFLVPPEPFVAANVLVVRMPDGTVVFCSSPVETQATRALVAWVRGALAPSKMVAINTHFH